MGMSVSTMMNHYAHVTSAFFLFRHHSQAHPTWPDSPKDSQRSFDSTKVRNGKQQRRVKSYEHTDPEVVTVGMHRYPSLLWTCSVLMLTTQIKSIPTGRASWRQSKLLLHAARIDV